MAHFYLTLPSNSSMLYYPNNTLTQYTTRLANAISLTGEWEVGLAEIQYQHSWQNLERPECRFTYAQYGKYVEDIPRMYLSKLLRLSPGYYQTPSVLAEAINTLIKEAACGVNFETYPRFMYNPITKRLNADINSTCRIQFSPALCSMLGLGGRQNPIENEEESNLEWKSTNACDINRGFSSLYVYCNVLEHVPVGDTKAPLLRIVRATDKSGYNEHIIYEKPLYVPLQQKTFDSIEIDIRTDVGNPIPFEYGKVIVTLHFRRSKIPYLLQ
jgi:hypothetical protein